MQLDKDKRYKHDYINDYNLLISYGAFILYFLYTLNVF